MENNMNDLIKHRLLSRKEAADFLGVKENTLAVWRTTQRYRLPVVKIGRLSKYKLSDLEKFVESQITDPDPSKK